MSTDKQILTALILRKASLLDELQTDSENLSKLEELGRVVFKISVLKRKLYPEPEE